MRIDRSQWPVNPSKKKQTKKAPPGSAEFFTVLMQLHSQRVMFERTYRISKKVAKRCFSREVYSKVRNIYHKAGRSIPGYLCSLPDFIILGAQKCGTSSLYTYLSIHPNVIPARKKEIHFFDNNFHEGEKWYRSHFPFIARTLSNVCITGEASPYYLYHPQVASRISEVLQDPKLIILLRDPVDRAISHYWHEVNSCDTEYLTMEEAFEKEEERLKNERERLIKDESYYSFNHQHFSYLERGKYLHQIKRFQKHFDEQNILIIKSERLFEDTQDAYDDVTAFLDIERYILEDVMPKKRGTYQRKTSQSIRDRLEKYYSDQKAKIEREIGITFG